MEQIKMKYYEIYNAKTGVLLAKGTARECKRILGCSSMDSFYALANRASRGKNKSYHVKIEEGGRTDYPVLGENNPVHLKERRMREEKESE